MARSDDAQKTLRLIAAYSEEILEAHLSRGNCLPDTEENQGLIERLKHHRLAWQIDEDEDPRLNKDLVKLLNHITESDRRRWANEQVDTLWRELTELFEQYRKARANVSLPDQDRLEGEIKEHLHLLIEDIRGATETFSAYLNSGFSYITDLELRIRQNEHAIDRAGRLTALFGSFNIQELADQAGSDPFLKRLLLKYLPATLEEGRRNLSYALNQLRVMLVRLREDQRLNRLVGGFETHYQNNPGYTPSIDHLDLEACPPPLNTVSPFQMNAIGDIYDPVDDEALIDLAASARIVDEMAPQESPTPDSVPSVDFDVDGEVVEEPEDPVAVVIDDLIRYLLDGDIGDRELCASEVLINSDLDIALPEWLATLSAELDALTGPDQAMIDIQYHHEQDPVYPDNHFIYDLILRQSHAG
ncbi:hypothetical protein MLC59_18500 [Marinobacter bryozoorum]|uniref:hypothetical protein n=1 Tax=Marinobacter bryozoorum TaxID=256324 RepID=UPI002005B412|nr:hypothetical protein [Marinobacter bryozoorum]MCK7546152.1 hypothetical protein [Marinobacter bryozoorum]